MSNLLESYRVLGVKVGAGMADVTTSYRQLCREYHPDISDNPDAEELMKQVNLAYTVLREKFRREAKFRERQTYTRPVRRYPTAEARQPQQPQEQPKTETRKETEDLHKRQTEEYRRRRTERVAVSAEAETDARAVLHNYFKALNTFDYANAYNCLSVYDKRNITPESFAEWRESVARLYPMREFKIAGGSSIAVITWGGDKTFNARKFRVIITEDDYTENSKQSGDVDKLVINEDGKWGVFLGYREVSELTRTFDKRFETKKKQDIEKRLEEYTSGLHTEYNMLNMDGMRKSASKELYRQRRYGGTMTFTALSVKQNDAKNAGQAELLRSAAKTICSLLRETDIPAYAGDGIFAILFIELGKKNAENIIERLVETIRKNAGPQLGEKAEIEYTYESWSGNSYADMENLNQILLKFNKKM
jgi:curved DNA-binding protein CbpA